MALYCGVSLSNKCRIINLQTYCFNIQAYTSPGWYLCWEEVLKSRGLSPQELLKKKKVLWRTIFFSIMNLNSVSISGPLLWKQTKLSYPRRELWAWWTQALCLPFRMTTLVLPLCDNWTLSEQQDSPVHLELYLFIPHRTLICNNEHDLIHTVKIRLSLYDRSA